MKNLRKLRIVLSLVLLLASIAYFTLGGKITRVDSLAYRIQIIPSLGGIFIGVILFWIMTTFVFGRIYCSTVCPAGTIQDIIMRARKFMPRLARTFRYRRSSHWRYDVLVIYIICLITGVAIVPMLIEPWNIFANIMSVFRPTATEAEWIRLGVDSSVGIIAGVVSILLLAVCAIATGRGFCNNICPIGTALSIVSTRSLYHIEIDPDKCTSCMKCEYACKSECIKVIGRHVDNPRCVRCFDCIDVCDNDAIHLQINRNRPATPMMRKMNRSTGKS